MGQVPFCIPQGGLDPWRWVVGVLGECMAREGGAMYPDVSSPDTPPPELLGSTKRLNINYQDADG